MNPDPRHTPLRREYRLCAPTGALHPSKPIHEPDPEDIAPWVIAAVRTWPRSVEDRQVAVRIGVGVPQVRVARRLLSAA